MIRTMTLWTIAAAALLSLAAPAPALANGGFDPLWQAGAVAIMRHALAPGTGDPRGFDVDDFSTQRNLDERGREQARALGAALRATGLEFDRVLTSQWCRCIETAELLEIAPVEEFEPLNSFFADRSTRGQQTEAVRAFLQDLPDDERIVLVTHQVNITALTGRGVSSGELFIIDVADDGTVAVLERVRTGY